MEQQQEVILPIETPAAGIDVPFWDRRKRRLYFRSELVKAFTSPASHQEMILSAFQEQGWPEAVVNPLPGASEDERHLRLERAVRRLNGRQRSQLLAFHVCAAGTNVSWEHFFQKSSGTEVLALPRDVKD